MVKLTIKSATKRLNELGGARHDVSKMVKAARVVAKRNKLKPIEVFELVTENKPIEGAYTHSYGFHTATGRALIDGFSSEYYSLSTI